LHFREPILTAHLPTPKRLPSARLLEAGLRAGRLVLQRRDSFEAHLPAGRQERLCGEGNLFCAPFDSSFVEDIC